MVCIFLEIHFLKVNRNFSSNLAKYKVIKKRKVSRKFMKTENNNIAYKVIVLFVFINVNTYCTEIVIVCNFTEFQLANKTFGTI